MTLQEIWSQLYNEGHRSDKGDIHSYLPVYEEILAPYRESAKNVLEIGLLNGASLRMWERYFNCNVYGIDCDLKPIGGMADLQPMIKEGTHKIIIGDAEDPYIVAQNFGGIKFDVIIEDANHSVEQQLKLYKNFKPYLADDGIYIIEDIQDTYSQNGILKALDDHYKEEQICLYDLRHIKQRYDDVLITIK